MRVRRSRRRWSSGSSRRPTTLRVGRTGLSAPTLDFAASVAEYTKVNLMTDVEDLAPKHGLGHGLESRFARGALELENQGLSYFRIAAGFRTPFGHSHSEQEEIYLVIDGSARVK